MWFDAISPQGLVVVFTSSGLAAALATVVASWADAIRKRRSAQAGAKPRDIAFLFRGADLVDSSDAADRILELSETDGSDLDRIVRLFSPRFPTLSTEIAGTETAPRTLLATDGRARLHVAGRGDTLRLRMEALKDDMPAATQHLVEPMMDLLRMHRGLTSAVDFPMWRLSENGALLWANAAYHQLADATDTPLFADQLDLDLDGGPQRVRRVRLDLPAEAEPRWFELFRSRSGASHLVVAVPVDRVVQAERSLSGFVQTLTQTFAHLNVGLAVFNRTRELAIFNPAMSELMDLSPEFLVTRPSLYQVFDRMREQRMVPEPKDYKSWRRKMSALEAAAADTDYSETWSLVDGRTFRVTGRPHPEGAIAFLFEDISDEISLERKFRTELQMGHAVIDGLDEAIAVFASSGAMVLANRAYKALWTLQPSGDETKTSFIEATRTWQHRCQPTPVWGDARDFAATIGERSNWMAEVRMSDGRLLDCRFDALSGGYTLAGFSKRPAPALPLHPAQQGAARLRA